MNSTSQPRESLKNYPFAGISDMKHLLGGAVWVKCTVSCPSRDGLIIIDLLQLVAIGVVGYLPYRCGWYELKM